MTLAATSVTSPEAGPDDADDPAPSGVTTTRGTEAGRPTADTRSSVPDVIRRRLAPFDARRDPRSWIATAFVVAIAGIIRFANLGHPPGKIFDETYYAKDAYGLLSKAVEWNYKDNAPAYVVHPPLGKWLIALGEWAFGYQDADGNVRAAGHLLTTSPEFGWRFSAAVAGTISVLILVRVARRMFGSTILGCVAGLLLAIDGFHVVLSRTALLDIFLLLFILGTFAALVLDRDARRRRWLAAMENGLDPTRRGRAGRLAFTWREGVPWWRLGAAVMFGCAVSVKWSALFFLPAFVLMILWWEIGLRRSVGARHPWRDTFLDELGWIVLFGVVVVGVYLVSWTGWFVTDHGFYRHWLADGGQAETPVIGALNNLWHYHEEAFRFHQGLEATHTYQSWPWQWLILGRPVAFYWSNTGTCGTDSCASEVLLLGTPVLWWSFLPALAATLWLGISRRDWRAGAVLTMVFFGFAPWFYYAIEGRTMFSFYLAPALPFLVLAVVYALGAIMSPARSGLRAGGSGDLGGNPGGRPPDSGRVADRRTIGGVVVGAYLLLVTLCFAYFYKIFVGEVMPYAEWSIRMWLGSRWI